jgi:hypothetical protein
MSQSELYEWIAHLDCSAQPGDDEELTQAARLAHPKGAILDSSDRLQALLGAAHAQLMIHLEVKEPRA